MKTSHHFLLLSTLGVSLFSLGGCDSDAEPVEFGNASFTIEDSEDCIDAFNGMYLTNQANNRGWDEEDINAFCAEVADIAVEYNDNETLTVVTFAGTAQVTEEQLQGSWFVSAVGYNIDALRSWGESTREAEAIRTCVRDAREVVEDGDTLEDGFVSDCMAEQSGEPFPEAIFQEQRSSVGVDEPDGDTTGAAIALAIYNNPDGETVIAFMGGGFYAQSEPNYSAFLGCGAAVGFNQDAGEPSSAALCVLAEYRGS